MLVLTKPYTDRHGITFPKAVFVVKTINFSSSRAGSFIVNTSNPKAVDYELVNQHEQMNLSFTASVYASLEAFETGKEGMPYRDNNGQEYINLNLPVDTPTTALLKHCEDKLLELVNA